MLMLSGKELLQFGRDHWPTALTIGITAIGAYQTIERYDAERQLNNLAQEVGGYHSVKPETVLRKDLKSVSDLPGTDLKVGPDQYAMLGRSTMTVVTRPRNTDKPWVPTCTANKVSISIKGNTTIGALTALHCVPYNTTIYDNRVAVNTVNITANEYALAPPRTKDNINQPTTPLAKIDGISVIIHGTEGGVTQPDVALLSVAPPTPRSSLSEYAKLTPLKLPNTRQPVPGEEVAQVSATSNATPNKTGVSATGRYINTVTDHSISPVRLYELVTIKAYKNDPDPLQPGGSGNLAIGARNEILGPLSTRLDNPYERGTKPRYLGDRAGLQLSSSYYRKLRQQETLDVRYDRTTVVGQRTALTTYVLSHLVAGLNNVVEYRMPKK